MPLFKKTRNLQVPDDLMSVVHYYEDTCVMGCCGTAALNLSPERAIDGMMDHGLEWAERGLASLVEMIHMVNNHSGPITSDHDGFGESWQSSELALKFLGDLKLSLSSAITQVRQNGLPDNPPPISEQE